MKYQFFPNLTADEMESLTADIKARGVMVPVEIDEQGAILDGHHRVMIADSLGIEYPKVVRAGWTEEQKLAHVVALNAHRRHLTPVQIKDVQRDLRERGMSIRAIALATDTSVGTAFSNTNDVFNVEQVTGRDGKSYPATRPPLAGPAGASALLPLESVPVLSDGSSALAPEPWRPSPALMSSDTPEWYTPKHILDAVVRTMGAIDLDPCAEPARTVPAKAHFTEVDDGLSREWAGRVYMNPPYGRPIAAWVDKLATEYNAGRVTQAVALVPGRIETDWFYALDAIWFCNIEGRLAFSEHGTAAPFPSVAVYLGREGDMFGSAFVSLGDVYERRWRFDR